MGQKVHPEGLRVGYIHDWKSQWFNDREFSAYLMEDVRIRDHIDLQGSSPLAPNEAAHGIAYDGELGSVELEDLDHEGENVGPPSHAGQRKLKRAGLQLPVDVQRGPTRREELLAAMHEVEEIARVGRAIVGRQGRSRRDHGKPNACRRRARDLPHSGRYRPRKGDG